MFLAVLMACAETAQIQSEEELFLEVTLIGGMAGGPLGAVLWTNLF